MIKVWIACFLILFGAAEMFLWLKDFFLPLPVYLLGGAFLAIASNYEKGIDWFLPSSDSSCKNSSVQASGGESNPE